MSKNFVLGGLAALVIALGLGWYFASPGLAMMQLKEAAQAGDEDALKESVDFPRLREELKSDLRREMAAEMASSETKGFEAMGAALAMALIDPLIDGFVTPEALAGMVKNGELKRPGETSGSEAAEAEWTIERDGLSRFIARPEDAEQGKAPGLVFEREGLGWVLVEIEIPEGGLGAPD